MIRPALEVSNAVAASVAAIASAVPQFDQGSNRPT